MDISKQNSSDIDINNIYNNYKLDTQSSSVREGDYDSDSIFSIINSADSDSDSDSYRDNNIDSGSIYDSKGDSDTDDDYDAGLEKTRFFLYRYFIISIIPSPTPGKPNIVFIKTTLLYTKGEDNNPRM